MGKKSGKKSASKETGENHMEQFYQIAHKIGVSDLSKMDSETLAKQFGVEDNKMLGLSLRIVGKIAAASETFEEFVTCLEQGDLPTVKLTAEEMNVMKGGGPLQWIMPGVKYAGSAIFGAGTKMGRAEFDFLRQNLKPVASTAQKAALELQARGAKLDWGRMGDVLKEVRYVLPFPK